LHQQSQVTGILTGQEEKAMDFGLFMMPLHPPRRSFADAYDRDIALIVQADQRGIGVRSLPTDLQLYGIEYSTMDAV